MKAKDHRIDGKPRNKDLFEVGRFPLFFWSYFFHGGKGKILLQNLLKLSIIVS
jgi:hypothetical protein